MRPDRPWFALATASALAWGLALLACEGDLLSSGADADGGLDAGPTADSDGSAPPPDPDGSAPPPDDGGAAGDDAGPGGSDAGSDRCAGVSCGANARCEPGTGECACNPGFVEMGGACVAPPPGDPAGRTEAEVCDAWRAGHAENAADPWIEDPADRCAPGTMPREAYDDTLRRINLFRWLVGLAPVTDDPAQHPNDQACALMMTVNGRLDHMPPPTWTCYSEAGAQGARTSNLALGVRSPADAIDLYMDDSGVPSLGHRRWVLNGPLGRVGIGFAGNAQCLGVFDMSGSSERPWTAWPNPGPVPVAAIRGMWSFHSNRISMRTADVAVVRAGDGTALAVRVDHPPDGYGPSTVSFEPMGWRPEVGQRYRVTVTGIAPGEVSYEVAPVACP